MGPKGLEERAKSVYQDQTAPGSSLILVCTVCADLSVPIFRISTVVLSPILDFE